MTKGLKSFMDVVADIENRVKSGKFDTGEIGYFDWDAYEARKKLKKKKKKSSSNIGVKDGGVKKKKKSKIRKMKGVSDGGGEKKKKKKKRTLAQHQDKCARTMVSFNKRNSKRPKSERRIPGEKIRTHCVNKMGNLHMRRYPGGGTGKYLARNPKSKKG